MSILRLYQYLETKRQSNHSTGRCSKHDSGERCHEEAHMHQDPSGMLARIPFGLTTGPIEGAEILVAGCRKETVATVMRSNVLKYRDTLMSYTQNRKSRNLCWWRLFLLRSQAPGNSQHLAFSQPPLTAKLTAKPVDNSVFP